MFPFLCLNTLDSSRKFPDIPEPIIPINVTVIFLGSHKSVSDSELQPDVLDRWFRGLSHTLKHKETNESKYYETNEKTKYQALKYHYSFQEASLPEKDHLAFEKALLGLSRVIKWNNNNNQESEKRIIHPYSVEMLLESIIDYYEIPGYPFFIYASKYYDFSFCEGLHPLEISSPKKKNKSSQNHTYISKDNKQNTYNENLDLQNKTFSKISLRKEISWAEQIENMLSKENDNFLGGWQSTSQVIKQITQHSLLWPEFNQRTTKASYSCSKFWVGHGRFLWADVTSIASNLILPSQSPSNFNDDPKYIANLYKTYCDNSYMHEDQNKAKICASILERLRQAQSKMTHQINQKEALIRAQQFLSNVSSIIINGLYSIITPETPTFETFLPDKFSFSITVINEILDESKYKVFETSQYKKNINEIEQDLRSYVIAPSKPHFNQIEESTLEEWSQFGLLIYNNETINLSEIREELQELYVPHRPQFTEKNITSRDIVSLYILHHVISSSFSRALDYISFSISNPNHFEKLPGLRSTLVHMYGLVPSQHWHSLSVMCPSSHHSELNQISKDVAYRNAMRTELSAVYIKLRKLLNQLEEIINFVERETGGTVNISTTVIEKQATEIAIMMENVLQNAGTFNFEYAYGILGDMKKKRKALGRLIKSIQKDVKEQMCLIVPKTKIQKPPTFEDKLDKFAISTFFIWLAILAFGLLVFLSASFKHAKQS